VVSIDFLQTTETYLDVFSQQKITNLVFIVFGEVIFCFILLILKEIDDKF
jgi:hypothetical protein